MFEDKQFSFLCKKDNLIGLMWLACNGQISKKEYEFLIKEQK